MGLLPSCNVWNQYIYVDEFLLSSRIYILINNKPYLPFLKLNIYLKYTQVVLHIDVGAITNYYLYIFKSLGCIRGNK